MRLSARGWTVAALVAAAVVLVLGRLLAAVYVDHAWYAALGAGAVWRAKAANVLLLRGLSLLVGGAFIFANLWGVRASIEKLVVPRRVADLEIGAEVPGWVLVAGAGVLALLVGALLTFSQDGWATLALARYGVPFNESDAYFDADLGFYVYQLPFETALFTWALVALAAAVALVVFFYAVTTSIRWGPHGLRVTAHARRHLSVLCALALLAMAWRFRLDLVETLVRGSGPDGAFTWTDHKVHMRADLYLALFAVVAALIVGWSGWVGQTRAAFGVTTVVLVATVLLRQALPSVAGRLGEPGEAARRDREYQAIRASYSRRAFAVDFVVPASTSLAAPAVAGPAALARAVPLWDDAALRGAAERDGGAEVIGAVGWRAVGDTLVAELARPPAGDAAPDAAWPVSRYVATRVDERGFPERGGVLGTAAGEQHSALAAYVHPGARGYLVVPDSAALLAAPGIGAWGARLAHAWHAQNFRLLLGPLPASPRLVMRRDVHERVAALAPVFRIGRRVHPVALGDTIFWLAHLYSASDTYPLGHALVIDDARVRYLQHAGLAVVHGHTGRVRLVAASHTDPVARTWIDRFPELWVPYQSLPAPLRAAIPPAVEAAYAQATMFALVGPRGTAVVTRGRARASLHDSLGVADAPVTVAVPTVSGPLAWPIPIVGDDDAVRGVLVAGGGVDRRAVFVPSTAVARWPSVLGGLQRPPRPDGRAEPRTVGGVVRLVPLAGGALAAVQPHYLSRPGEAPPLSSVRAIVGGAELEGRTLAELFGGEPARPASAPLAPPEFRERVRQLYERMRLALQRGDLRAFGEAYGELGAAVAAPAP